MSRFTEAELDFLSRQQIGRLATIDKYGNPQNKPVGFNYNHELGTIDIGGPDNGKSQKYHNVARNGRASFVIDDMTPEGLGGGIEIRARAEIVPEGEGPIYPRFSAELIRLTPIRIITWDLAQRLPTSARNTEDATSEQ